MAIGDQIKKRREDLKYMKTKFARRIDRSQSWVTSVEKNFVTPDPEMIKKIEEVLEFKIER